MDNFKRTMTFSRSERIAIITIVSMIVIILIAKYLIIKNPPKRDYFKHDLDSIIARREAVLDSIRVADSLANETAKANKIPRYARNDKKHSNRGIISSEPRQKGEGNREISCKKSEINSPKVNALASLRSPLPAVSRNDVVIDINTADTTMLKQLPGIGSSFAKWIVEYRNKLGGYCEKEQLLEVYRMDTTRYNGIKDFVIIDSAYIPSKLKINTDAFKVLLKHPYLEYEDVKKIVNYREQKGMITSWEHLAKIVGDSANHKLRYYIDYQ